MTRWSTRLSAGYTNSDPYSRPSGQDSGHPGSPRDRDLQRCRGRCRIASEAPRTRWTAPRGTRERPSRMRDSKQPKFDARFDQDMSNGGRVSLLRGILGHQRSHPHRHRPVQHPERVLPGLWPGGLQQGRFQGRGVRQPPRRRGAEPPAHRSRDRQGCGPELQDPDLRLRGRDTPRSWPRSTFSPTAATRAGTSSTSPWLRMPKDRNEFGGYFQDEFFVDKFRLTVGGRVDKFGNIDKAVFSPRVTAMFKPAADQSFRVSFNKAFRAPVRDQQLPEPEDLCSRSLPSTCVPCAA